MLTAAWLNQSSTASFTAAGSAQTLKLLLAPPANVNVGDVVKFSYEIVGSDGVTPVPQQSVWLTVSAGTFGFRNCGSGNCKASTGATGVMAISGTAYVPGTVTVAANYGTQTIATSFVVSAKAYTMTTVSAPSGSYAAGGRSRRCLQCR